MPPWILGGNKIILPLLIVVCIWIQGKLVAVLFKKNLGWSILPYTRLEYFADDIRIEPLYWNDGTAIERETNLYYHPRKPQRKAVQAFIDYVQQHI